MKFNRRTVIVLLVVGAVGLLAFLMRHTIEARVIQPLIFLFWVLGVYYKTLPQALIWIILIGLILFIEIGSFANETRLPEGRSSARRHTRGGVETLADWFRRAPQGLYYKWLLAQRLGKFSRDLIAFKARKPAPSGAEALYGPGWDPPHEVAQYLESGLNGSFADYPRPRWPFQRPASTPLDLDPVQAIDYIETQAVKE